MVKCIKCGKPKAKAFFQTERYCCKCLLITTGRYKENRALGKGRKGIMPTNWW